MKPLPPNGLLLIACAAVITLIVFMGASHPPGSSRALTQEGSTQSQPNDKAYERLIPSLKGPDLFRSYCAPCHGTEGHGDGPVAPALKAAIPDLTIIAKRNGGNFPAKRISDLIAGEDVVVAHGSREMPVWGPIFHQVEYDRDYGNIRMKNLVDYLRSIQQK
jgi:cbb3-type cytochrome c oxidase subunit III